MSDRGAGCDADRMATPFTDLVDARDSAPRALTANAADSPAVQVSPAAGGEQLPFTGFAALYAALVGAFMLMTGIALCAYERVRSGQR